jgi:hypothetical protein
MVAHPARALAVALAVSSWCAPVFAFPTSRLTYARGSGAEACPEEPTIRQAVAARLGYDPFFAAAEKTIVARILRNRDELRATVELVDDHGIVRGVREFKSRVGQCAELVATMALAISIAIDPTNPGILGEPAKARPEPPQPTPASLDRPAPPSARVPSPVQPREVDTAIKPDRPAEPVPELRVGAAAIGAVGTAPGVTAGLALSAGLRRDLWSMNVEGRAELPRAITIGSAEARTSLWAVALVPCVHFDPLVVCATGWLGSLRAQGWGFPTSRTDRALYAAAGLRLGLELPITTGFTFRPEIDLLATLFPVDLKVDGATQWMAPSVASLLRMGVMAHFP